MIPPCLVSHNRCEVIAVPLGRRPPESIQQGSERLRQLSRSHSSKLVVESRPVWLWNHNFTQWARFPKVTVRSMEETWARPPAVSSEH